MKTGQSHRDYETNKTYWVVEGFSKQSMTHVYPHQGWSWTEWKATITDTYKSYEEAKRAISGGYLKDMIEHQKIVDIRFFEVTVTRKIAEDRVVRSFGLDGEEDGFQEPHYAVSLGALSRGDYLVLDNNLYGEVDYIRDGLMGVDIINGCWHLVLDITGDVPVIDATSPKMENRAGEAVPISHIGVPDTSTSFGDYNQQLNYYRENFDQNVLTSTLRTAVAA